MSEMWRWDTETWIKERRGAAIGLTQAETLKPAAGRGLLGGHGDAIAVEKAQRRGTVEKHYQSLLANQVVLEGYNGDFCEDF